MRIGAVLGIGVVLCGAIFLLAGHTGNKVLKTASEGKVNRTVSQGIKQTGSVTENKLDAAQGSRAGKPGTVQSPGKEQAGSQNENQQVEKLTAQYQPQFQEIYTLADKRETNLLEQAMQEVKDRKEKKISTQGIQVKYAGIFNQYEQNTKLQFDAVAKQLQEDIVKKKLPQTAELQFQQEYQLKKAERNQRFNQQLEKLG